MEKAGLTLTLPGRRTDYSIWVTVAGITVYSRRGVNWLIGPGEAKVSFEKG